MTAKKGTLARLLVDEFDFSGDQSGITATVAMAEEERTTLQAMGMAYEPILPSLKIEQNGYLFSNLVTEAALSARLGVGGVYVAALFGTDAMGCPAYVLDGTFKQSMVTTAPMTGLITLNGAWGMGPNFSRGIRIWEGALSATGAQAAIDLGAAGAAGGEAYLFVQSITGTATNAVILVESSATEGGVYATEATFTFSAVGGFKQAMTGTVNRWVRLNVSDLGGADAFTVVLVAAVDGVTQ